MSESQNLTATSSKSFDPLEPTADDVELLHRIILRAQQQPFDDDRLNLLSAYESTLRERGIDPRSDKVCYRLILEILKPDVEGDRLYTKFENVLRDKGLEVVFTDDETSTKDTIPSSARDNNQSSRRHSTMSSNISVDSHQPFQALMPGPDRIASLQREREDYIDNPPPQVMQLMQRAIDMDKNALIRQCIQMFQEHQRAQQLRAMEQTARKIYERKLKFKVLTHWYNLQQQISSNYVKAHTHYIQHKASSTLGNMLDSARVNRMHAMEDERLRGMSLYRMTIAARESNFCRKMDFRIKHKYMRCLLDNIRSRSARNQVLGNLLGQNQPRFDARMIRAAMATLVSTSSWLDSTNSFAQLRCASKLKSLAMGEWVKKSQQVSSNAMTAQSFRQCSLMKKYFIKMKESVRIKVMRREALSRTYFIRWREIAQNRKRKRLKVLHLEYRKKFKMKLARRALANMTDKVRHVQYLQGVAIDSQTSKLNCFAHDVVVRWYHRSQQIRSLEGEAAERADKSAIRRAMRVLSERRQQSQHLDQIASQFHHIHTQSVAADCLKMMSRKSFEVNRRQQDADAFRARHNRQTIRTHVDRLRRKAAENRGEGPLVLPPATPAQRRADQLYRLASTTPLLAPKTSFAARLRGEATSAEEAGVEVKGDT